ncbi:MAG: dethiobiotin synthase [Arsenophonus endosymbiont of Ceratovacuna japonica]
MNKCFFLTGTDTNVGKTVTSCLLLQAASKLGYKTAGYKPISSGNEQSTVSLKNLDAKLLKINSNIKLNYYDINPISFMQKTSPHIASQLSEKIIDWQIMSSGLNKLKQLANWIIVEGIGGWYTPICNKQTLADWVIQQQLPVILVVGIKLGCINHAILTLEAIEKSGLLLSGWIANEIISPDQYKKYYLQILQQKISAPLLGIIPYLPNCKSYIINNFIDLNKLL